MTSTFDPAKSWTLSAGGDVNLDRAVYAKSVLEQLGPDYAWDGRSAAVDRRFCCGWGGRIIEGRRTNDGRPLASLFRDADLALVNLESPEPARFTYHSSGYVFTGSPALLQGLADAGIDAVSLANNHIGNGGTQGILETIGYLDRLGIAHAGAGANITAARRPAWLSGGGLKIAFLAYSWVEPVDYVATAYKPGSAGYPFRNTLADIASAKAAGADLVIVMPHWGIEYTDALMADQTRAARQMFAAGADLILGSHSHWFGTIASTAPSSAGGSRRLVFYSLGNLVFDWKRDERSQLSAVVDLTFVGTRLVQADLHPVLIIDGQPNLLDPAGDGAVVLDQVRGTSGAALGW